MIAEPKQVVLKTDRNGLLSTARMRNVVRFGRRSPLQNTQNKLDSAEYVRPCEGNVARHCNMIGRVNQKHYLGTRGK